MQNDVLKNKIAPWQEKGRWYHIRVENGVIIQEKSDSFSYSWSAASPYIYLTDMAPIDCKFVIEKVDYAVISTAIGLPMTLRIPTTTDLIGINVGASLNSLVGIYGDMYIFANKL